MLPILVGGTVWLIVAFIIQTGSKNATWKEYKGAWLLYAVTCIDVHFIFISLCSESIVLKYRTRR